MAFKDKTLVFSQPGALNATGLEEVIQAVKNLDLDKLRAEAGHQTATLAVPACVRTVPAGQCSTAARQPPKDLPRQDPMIASLPGPRAGHPPRPKPACRIPLRGYLYWI